MSVPVSHYLYSLFVFVFVINHSFILFIVRSFVCFISSVFAYFIVVRKEKKNNSDPELCSGILIPLPMLPVQHHHLESINIIQQTPPTLS
jgi:hypothetical protein